MGVRVSKLPDPLLPLSISISKTTYPKNSGFISPTKSGIYTSYVNKILQKIFPITDNLGEPIYLPNGEEIIVFLAFDIAFLLLLKSNSAKSVVFLL